LYYLEYIFIKKYRKMEPIVKNKRALSGVILVLAGSLLLADRTGLLPDVIPGWIWTWKFLLVAIGFFSLLTSDHREPGIILIVIGGIFLIPNIFSGVDIDTKLLWYVAIIAVGVFLIFASRGKHPVSVHRQEQGGEATDENLDMIDEFAMFAGGEKIFSSANFQGGRITTIFGGFDFDLSRCKLAPGQHQIEVFALFGGWEITVPPNWNIKTDVTSILGGVSDKRQVAQDTLKDTTRTLVIKGTVIFGGGELKSYLA
jgi:predicted membrane protein